MHRRGSRVTNINGNAKVHVMWRASPDPSSLTIKLTHPYALDPLFLLVKLTLPPRPPPPPPRPCLLAACPIGT
jgi:hypothetical protein